MVRWGLAVRIAASGLVLAACASTAMAADPFVLFLLRMIRDQTVSSAIESGVTSAQQKPKPPSAAPAPLVSQPPSDGQWLRALIDESFVHLSARQREELHASLARILADPNNAAHRSTIIAEFTAQAVAMRDAHRQLSRLSDSDMRQIAAEARAEYARLPQAQREQLLQALQDGVPGMPRALHDLMLAEFNNVPADR
ncbi:MAG: hypothetical protein HYY78_10395 [Betaproteobacteria bacterium]|nr:hypothetical protein [Betaproteobacteria bacterium]